MHLHKSIQLDAGHTFPDWCQQHLHAQAYVLKFLKSEILKINKHTDFQIFLKNGGVPHHCILDEKKRPF